jgi:hypothetical protein
MTLYAHTSGSLSTMPPCQVEQLTLDWALQREAKRNVMQRELNMLHRKADLAVVGSPAYLNCIKQIAVLNRQIMNLA